VKVDVEVVRAGAVRAEKTKRGDGGGSVLSGESGDALCVWGRGMTEVEGTGVLGTRVSVLLVGEKRVEAGSGRSKLGVVCSAGRRSAKIALRTLGLVGNTSQ